MPDPGCDFYFDTVALSNFALAGRLDLLVSRYGSRAWVTPAVLDEILDGIVAGYAELREIESALTAAKLSSAPPLSAAERNTFRELLRILAPGEASCIACAQTRGGTVVTDDRIARQCCAERNVKFTGTIGILKACCLNRMLSLQEADVILQAMIDAGYFSPVRSISGII